VAAVAVHRLSVLLLFACEVAQAHLANEAAGSSAGADGAAPGTAAAWAAPWSFEPWVVVCLAASALAYLFGLRRLWHRAGTGRGVSVAQAAAFFTGWITLVIALISPVDVLGNLLFSAHMLQHELLMVVAAPLMVLARPLAVWVWAMPAPLRPAVGRLFHQPAWRTPWLLLTSPLYAWLVHALALWLWHLPRLFEASLASNAVHTLQHFSFLFTALLFWWSALGQSERAGQGTAMLYLFTTMVHTSALGALLTLSPFVWYPSYAQTAPALGLSALEDQQLGGLVMWVPAGAAYFVTGLVLAMRWIGLGRPPVAG
jgi:putative membrane protein